MPGRTVQSLMARNGPKWNLDDLGLATGTVASVITVLQGLTAAVAALHG